MAAIYAEKGEYYSGQSLTAILGFQLARPVLDDVLSAGYCKAEQTRPFHRVANCDSFNGVILVTLEGFMRFYR